MNRNNDELIYRYYQEISDFKPLSRSEETRLVLLAQSGDMEARDNIIKSNTKFVIKIAKMYQNQGHPLCDLINEGNLGLINAINRFDVTSGNKLISYAVWWIREAINTSLNETSRSVRLPVNLIVKNKANLKFIDKFIAENQIEPSIGDVLDNGEELTRITLPDAHSMLKLDDEIPESNLSYVDVLSTEPVESESDNIMIRDEIMSLLNDVTDRERDIVSKYFGLDGGNRMTLLEISEIYGLSLIHI